MEVFSNSSTITPSSSQPQQQQHDSQPRSHHQNNNNNNNLSKAAIVEWVNTSIDPPQSFSCVKEIPSKVAAAIMNDIFGDTAFSLRGINFTHQADKSDFAIAKRNCDVVLEGAGLLGFTGASFSGHSWADGVKDYGGVLMFWRWLRQKALEKPLSKCVSAVEVGLENNNNNQRSSGSARTSDNSSNLPPLSQVPHNRIGNNNNNIQNNNNNNNNNVVRLSDVIQIAGIENMNNGKDGSSSSSSYNGPFMCGGPNGDIAKQLFEANFKELEQMRKQHGELQKAIQEGNLNKLVSVLQLGHQMK